MTTSYSLKDLDANSYERQKSLPNGRTAIEERNVSMEMPHKIGEYSLTVHKENGTREVTFDASKLTYLWLPPLNSSFSFDLTEGYDKYKHINWCSSPNVKLNEFLQWIIHNRSLFSRNGLKPLEVDFLTYRGVLTKLMSAPFVRDKWVLGATKFKGTIYLCPYYEEEQRDELFNLMSYGGLRFENYLSRSDANRTQSEPFTSEKGEFSVVMKSKLQLPDRKISLMYAAEVDCLDIDKSDTNVMENFVEIKTTKEMYHENQFRNFRRFKLIKWWAQSYLIGVPKIICGFKDDDHTVNRIEKMNVHQLPQQCNQFWSRRQCLNFLSQFLTYVEQMLKDDDSDTVYLFSNEVPNVISARRLFLSSQFQILPEWYIRELNKINAR